MTKQTLLIALGGNALIRPGQQGTVQEQFANLAVPVRQIARLSRQWRLVITHGNGPQVGNLLLQQEACREVPPLPLEVLVAQTQGQLGYLLESSLDGTLAEMGEKRHLVSLISYVVVEPGDPAFAEPTKPIGPALAEEAARAAAYPVRRTARGWRRVVASPEPVTIVEKEEIRRLLELDFIVICCGGGGIPVIREGRAFHGIEAVIDKDLASARLALEAGVEVFLIATDVPGAALNYGRPAERFLRRLPVAEAERLQAEGHFPAGSMGPKVEAAVRFVRGGGKRAVICALEEIERAVAGEAGTEVMS